MGMVGASETYENALIDSVNSSCESSVRGSNECPSPPCPTSSSAVRPIHSSTSSSRGLSLTRASIAALSYHEKDMSEECLRAKISSRGAHFVSDTVENWREIAHVRAGEDRCEHFALLLVRCTLREEQPGANDKPSESINIHYSLNHPIERIKR